MGFTSFEEIEVWQEARLLSRAVRTFTKRATQQHDWGWTEQISKASLSIMANIAEGNDAGTNPEFCRFLTYAKRSCAEVRSHLYYGLDAMYLNSEELEDAVKRTKKICAQIAMLIRYLQAYSR